MARYIKKFTHIGSVGPTEERGFAIWAGYDIVGVEADLTEVGLVRVDDWSEREIAARGVTTFVHVDPDDESTYRKLGIPRRTG